MAIHWLGTEACADATHVGAKAANLSRLGALARVPAGFAIPDLDAATEALPTDLAAEVRAAYADLAARVGEAPGPALQRGAGDIRGGASFAWVEEHDRAVPRHERRPRLVGGTRPAAGQGEGEHSGNTRGEQA